jgi:hydrocephalus-inducing protein
LVISIENIDPNSEPLVVELDGEAERPICHFELPPSKFREKKPDLDSNYHIIEFESLGTKVKNTKRFYVVNPTSTGYEFEWKRVEEGKLPPTANSANEGFFKCIISKGVILSGKKFEMIFEYSPDVIGTHESYWIFSIPE